PLAAYIFPLTAYANGLSEQAWRGLRGSGISFDLMYDLYRDLIIGIYPVDMWITFQGILVREPCFWFNVIKNTRPSIK
ncbi:hypothetical protein, partial [Enterobacter hormaechei]|uniref:hypothetical protein n=1 Tax=Enterobacter hormaechei TaxID=158836 RepID=UPI001CA309F6